MRRISIKYSLGLLIVLSSQCVFISRVKAQDYTESRRVPSWFKESFISETASQETKLPDQIAIYNAFSPTVRTRWDEHNFYIESNGIPHHRMMVGITAWQQQVPLPQNYTGKNAWSIPLKPVPAAKPLSAKTHFFRGAIALAANGVPIFNPIKNDGVTDTYLAGELDEFGGHSGRADDYHYHTAPVHLQKLVGEGNPIGYALDCYPLYGYTDQDGTTPKDLDSFNGHTTKALGYHYHATKGYPYLNGGFHGQVTEKGGQVDPQPRAQGPREATEPLRGATIVNFTEMPNGHSLLTYVINNDTYKVEYGPTKEGKIVFIFTSHGKTKVETYEPTRQRRPRPRGDDGEPRRPEDRP